MEAHDMAELIDAKAESAVSADVPEAPKKKKPAKKSFWSLELSPKKVKPVELMNFSRQCASFIRGGIPLLDSLDVIAQDSEELIGEVLRDMATSLREGSSLAAAAPNHPDVFPRYYVSMLRAAELTGRLDDVLDQLAVYLERDVESRRRIKSALTYPIAIGIMSVVTVVVLSAFVLPRFKVFFKELHAKLPLTTRMLLGTTDFFSQWWFVVVGVLAAGTLGVIMTLRTEKGQYKRDSLLLKLPGLGSVIGFMIVERFCRILSAMVTAGVALPDALAVSIEGTDNRVYQKGLREARAEMIRGEGLAKPIADTGLFPPAANKMIRVGESSGTLDKQLDAAAAFYERELNYKLKRFTDLFEPAIIIAMGAVVGFVAVALVQAMYGVFQQSKVG
jgi:type IV pilus assembly protein PilC